MMKITYEVPEIFKETLKNNNYKKNTKYSVTQLLKSVRAVILEQRYSHLIEYNVEDRLWSVFGSALHDIMEKADNDNSIVEERLSYGNVSGKFDYFDAKNGILYDFKFTSVWKAVYADEQSMKDYQIQLSIYAWLLEKAGFKVNKICNLLIFRDWKKSEYEHGKYKVPKPYATIEYDILHQIDGLNIKDWIDNTVKVFENYQNVEDNQLPDCDKIYRWAKQDTYAIMKGDNKRSTKNCDTLENAEKVLQYYKEKDQKNNYWIDVRKGDQFVRCEYCSINKYCNQYQEGKNEK